MNSHTIIGSTILVLRGLVFSTGFESYTEGNSMFLISYRANFLRIIGIIDEMRRVLEYMERESGMSKAQAEEIARKYIEAHREHFGKVTPQAIENAIRRVAGALHGLGIGREQK